MHTQHAHTTCLPQNTPLQTVSSSATSSPRLLLHKQTTHQTLVNNSSTYTQSKGRTHATKCPIVHTWHNHQQLTDAATDHILTLHGAPEGIQCKIPWLYELQPISHSLVSLSMPDSHPLQSLAMASTLCPQTQDGLSNQDCPTSLTL